MRPWDTDDIARLRRCAEQRYSLTDTAKLLRRSIPSILNKAIELRISINGEVRSGSPPLTTPHGGRVHAVRHLCRACGITVMDPVAHYRQVHRVPTR